jgi:phosphogluconate dehydratase
MLMEAMGLHLPGAAFVPPDTPLRDALTVEAVRRATQIKLGAEAYAPIGHVIDEKAVINGVVALLATGGSTNHTLHLPAIAAAAGITLLWEDIDALSAVVPLVAKVYPNGEHDVNRFQAAGGVAVVIAEMLGAGLMHDDVLTVAGRGLSAYAREPELDGAGALIWKAAPDAGLDPAVLAPAAAPFQPEGGLRLVDGPLGRGVVKTSAVKPAHRRVEAPCVVFDTQEALVAAFERGELDGRDLVAVVRFQGPGANGMPELHNMTPALGVLLDRGHRIALVTDGRMSGASGKVPAAIHVTPEAARGGPLARLCSGDRVRLDLDTGELALLVDAAEFAARTPAPTPPAGYGYGRELFAPFRAVVSPADAGASIFPAL